MGVEGRKVCYKCETVAVKFVTGVRRYTAQKKWFIRKAYRPNEVTFETYVD